MSLLSETALSRNFTSCGKFFVSRVESQAVPRFMFTCGDPHKRTIYSKKEKKKKKDISKCDKLRGQGLVQTVSLTRI